MNVKIKKHVITLSEFVFVAHPYVFSGLVSIIIMTGILFKSPHFISGAVSDDFISKIEFVNMEDVKTAKQKTVQNLTSDDVKEMNEETDLDRNTGVSEFENFTDISFDPSIAAPNVIGRLKDIYPEEARIEGVEATMNLEIYISEKGKVLKVDIKGIKLSKEYPLEKKKELINLFIRDTKKIFMDAKYTPPIINGKPADIIDQKLFKFEMRE